MDEIIKRLKAAGVSSETIESLKSGLGKTFETEILTNGFKSAAKKVGLDVTTLPDVDFKNALEAVEELTGKDLNRDGKVGDGDLKTGVTEALENGKEAIAHTDLSGTKDFVTKNATGLFAKVRSLFGGTK